MPELTNTATAVAAFRRWRRPGAALAALWYVLVYTHLVSLSLAAFAPAAATMACSCGAGAGGSCCSMKGAAGDGDGALPDESMGCHGPRSLPSACLFAAPCRSELPAAPQTETQTWPHLAARPLALQPRLASDRLELPRISPSFSLFSRPPEKVPKHHS